MAWPQGGQRVDGEGFTLERGELSLNDCIFALVYLPLQDLDRYASPIVQVKFDGPDIQEQSLYQLFRVS
jgi:hypothetical protein